MLRTLLLLLGLAVSAFGQLNFSLCDINRDGAIDVRDAQAETNQALGKGNPANDLTGDGAVTLLDVQTEINAVLYGCPLYAPTPRFAIVEVTVLNQAWIPSDIPSPGNLAIRAASTSQVSLLNQAWIPADIPSPGNLAVRAATASPATVLNQAWIPADIPSPGNLAVRGATASPVSVLNQAWISADIPSPGDLRFAAGLLVTVNNTAAGSSLLTMAGLAAGVIGAGSSTAPVDLASVPDGAVLLAGQTVRFRIYPPDEAFRGSDFLVNGAALRLHPPLEALLTVPAHVSALDLEAVAYSAGAPSWHTAVKHLRVISDPGLRLDGRALRDDRAPAASTAIGLRANGLTAEYFPAENGFVSWNGLEAAPARIGFVTAINQPETPAFGPDPFGTGLSGDYAARFHGGILAATTGPHRFFLSAGLGSRLRIDGSTLIDLPPGHFAPESQADVELTAGWHTIEVDSYQGASSPGLQLSWRQPDSVREVVRPEALAAELGTLAVTDAAGVFRVVPFPSILNPLEWHALPADNRIRIVLDRSTTEEKPIQP